MLTFIGTACTVSPTELIQIIENFYDRNVSIFAHTSHGLELYTLQK